LRSNYPALTDDVVAGATVLELDPRGFKVLKLANGNILKLFRLRRRWSVARWVGYAQRFCNNAVRLKRLAIPTVDIVTCYLVSDEQQLNHLPSPITFKAPRVSNTHTYAVEYIPLPGKTLKELLLAGQLGDAHIKQLGAFIADLHHKGIHFRSLHLGNVVLTPEGDMGLIDIADMRIYPWSLWFSTRLRSFRHVTRYAKLNAQFGEANWQLLINAYLVSVDMTSTQKSRLKRAIRKFIVNAPH
jgi:hypothetical protein